MSEQHHHEAEVHQHEHAHVTHYLSGGRAWDHLTASHDHEHNHSELTHCCRATGSRPTHRSSVTSTAWSWSRRTPAPSPPPCSDRSSW